MLTSLLGAIGVHGGTPPRDRDASGSLTLEIIHDFDSLRITDEIPTKLSGLSTDRGCTMLKNNSVVSPSLLRNIDSDDKFNRMSHWLRRLQTKVQLD